MSRKNEAGGSTGDVINNGADNSNAALIGVQALVSGVARNDVRSPTAADFGSGDGWAYRLSGRV
jgi:hypothetical protein